MSWMAVGGLAVSAAGSYLSSKGGKPGGITYAPSAYQSAKQNGQGKNLDSLMNNNTAYINNNMQRINSGRAPEYAENMVNQLAPYLQQQNKKSFLGRQGDRGGSVMGMGMQNAAMMGLNPKARASMMNKNMLDYGDQQNAINMQMAQYKGNAANQMAMALPGWAQGQQQATGNLMQVGPGASYGPTPGPYAGLGQAMGGMGGMMFGQGLSGLGSKPSYAGTNINAAGGGGYSGAMPSGAGMGSGNFVGGYQPQSWGI